MAFTKATFDYLDSGGLIKWITTAKTAAFTAVSGEGYLVDTSSAAITVTLPAAPSAGDEIIIVDYASNAETNNITLGRNSLKIRGGTDDLVLSTNNQTARLLYSGATKGWLVTTEAGAGTAAAATPDLTVDYLVVAGGGAGGNNIAGGGGAGGLRTSYGSTTGGGGTAESSLSLTASTNYTVTVGAGGTGGGTSAYAGANGSNSVFSTITSTGGGGGGGNDTTNGVSKTGGSGGGGSYNVVTGASAVTSPVTQGYAGGNGYNASFGAGGGGGGASATGTNATNTNAGGAGGNGLAVSINGTSVTYAGGGGGADYNGNGGSGGTGGGGAGAYGTSPNNATNPTAGIDNTGGGGGGAGWGSAEYGASGGSGVVILRYPDAYDITVGSGLTTGQLNTTVGTGEKYTTFTGGTGTITFAEA